MEPPPDLGNGTWEWVYHVRDKRPTPYVLQLERKVEVLTETVEELTGSMGELTGTVEELTGTVEELRGVVQTMYSVLAENRLIPASRDQDEPNSPEGRAEDVQESESRVTDQRDEDGQEAPPLNLKQEDESEVDMEIDEDCEPNMTGGSSPVTYWYKPPVSRRKRVSYKEQDSSSSSSPSPTKVKKVKRGGGHPRKQSSSATPGEPRVHQCVTCGEIFPYSGALSRHCSRSQPRHGIKCLWGTPFFINKSSWLKHKDSCDVCNFVVRNGYLMKVVDVD